MELQPSADGPQILAADALYQLGRVEEAYRLLLSIGPTNTRAPILARLALLQLHRGFLYDTNQVYKFGVPIFHVQMDSGFFVSCLGNLTSQLLIL